MKKLILILAVIFANTIITTAQSSWEQIPIVDNGLLNFRNEQTFFVGFTEDNSKFEYIIAQDKFYFFYFDKNDPTIQSYQELNLDADALSNLKQAGVLTDIKRIGDDLFFLSIYRVFQYNLKTMAFKELSIQDNYIGRPLIHSPNKPQYQREYKRFYTLGDKLFIYANANIYKSVEITGIYTVLDDDTLSTELYEVTKDKGLIKALNFNWLTFANDTVKTRYFMHDIYFFKGSINNLKFGFPPENTSLNKYSLMNVKDGVFSGIAKEAFVNGKTDLVCKDYVEVGNNTAYAYFSCNFSETKPFLIKYKDDEPMEYIQLDEIFDENMMESVKLIPYKGNLFIETRPNIIAYKNGKTQKIQNLEGYIFPWSLNYKTNVIATEQGLYSVKGNDQGTIGIMRVPNIDKIFETLSVEQINSDDIISFNNNIVTFKQEVSEQMIVDLSGRLVTKYDNFQQEIDLSSLGSNAYFVVAKKDNASFSKKIVIAK
jgi:hypothetical protein